MRERDKIWRLVEQFSELRPSEFRAKLTDKSVIKRLERAGATPSDIAKIILFKEDGNPPATEMKAFVDTMER